MYLKSVWLPVFLLCIIGALAVQSTAKIYWTSSTGIHRAELDGREHEILLSVTLSDPRSIAVDAVNGKIYWADRGTGKIQRANLDGTDIEDLTSTSEASSLRGIAVDPIQGKVYWVDGESPFRIQRSELDGTNVEDVITGSDTDILKYPRGIAVDVDAGKIYWTELRTPRIFRVNMDGTNAEVFITDDKWTEPRYPERLSIVVTGGRLYWVSYDQNSKEALIRSANLDGTDIKSVVNLNYTVDEGGRLYISCIAVDSAMGRIYWEETHSSSETGKIMSVNLDGTDAQQLIAVSDPSTRRTPDSMALNVADSKIYWIDSYVTDFGRASMIRWANLDGTAREDVFTYPLDYASAVSNLLRGISVDPNSGRIYWVKGSSSFDSSGEICGSGIAGITNPRFITLDTVPTVSVEATGKLATLWGRVRQDALLQNFPNPFNPETWIPYKLGKASHVNICIYDVTGHLIRKLFLGEKEAGIYMDREKAAYWDGKNQQGEPVSSGVYFYQLVTDDGFSATKKMLVVR